jgi:dienelactone hydrolase
MHTTSARASAREALSFRIAMALLAIAVLDDAFVHREPGTAAADHLFSGLVPVGVAAALAWAYPRLPAGARACAEIVCGLLALVAGVADGGRHVLVDRLAGDDLTALVAGVAGAVLLVAGVARLWRSRRRDGHWVLRRAARTAVALLAGFFVVVPVGMALVATHPARSPLTAADLGRPYERVRLQTSDGLSLAAWYVPSRNRAAVIVFPGRRGPLRHARLLARAGYGVLLLDRRGEGESEGTANLFGWAGERDLRAALDFLTRRSDIDTSRIGGLGLSVGGELLLQTAAHDQRLRAVVSEGAGVRSLAEHLHTPGIGSAQRWATNWLAQTAAVAVLSDTAPPPDLVEAVERIAPRRVLLIRGQTGHADEALNEVYARHIGDSAELWTAPGGHTRALTAAAAGYERRVLEFFGRALAVA